MARAQMRRTEAPWRRIAAVLLAIALAIGLVPGIPLGASIAYAGENVDLRVVRPVEYSNTFTNYMYLDGNIAFCGQPEKYAPPDGIYARAPINMKAANADNAYTPEDVAACLWFGFDGPGFDASLWPSTWFDGTPMDDDRYLVLTHIVLADFFTCDGLLALDDVEGGMRSWALRQVLMVNNGAFNPDSTQARLSARKGEVPAEFTANCFQINPGDNKQTIFGYRPGGWLDLSKVSANADTTASNPCYRLEGACYGVFRDAACTDEQARMTTDAAGYAKSGYLPTGAWYVKELEAPEGYALDPSSYRVEVRKGETARVNGEQVSDVPLCSTAAIVVAKLDAETGGSAAQGGASLADARFTVRYYRGYYATAQAAERSGEPARTWVLRTDGDGRARLADECVVSGDALYRASDGSAAIPLGTLLIQETKAPAGYHLSDSRVQVCQVTAAGTTETSTAYNAPSVADQVFRGDVEFVKARESDQNRMANIPFRIRNNATQESHIVVTDANGQASTATLWNAHTAKTNANDAAVGADGTIDESKLDPTAGVWFGASAADDAKGALPYGTYTIEELRVSGNAGLALIRMPNLTIDEREGHVVGLGTFDNQTISECAIATYAREYRSGGKSASADADTCIIDRVQYANLDVSEGAAYELHATLVDARSGAALMHEDGSPVSGFARFVPTQQNGYAEVSLSFDSRSCAGRDVAVYEELVKASTGAVVAEHKDAADYDQTVHINAELLRTMAFDPDDGDKVVPTDPQARMADAVRYRNLIAGEEYELRGELWLKAAAGSDEAVGDAEEDAGTVEGADEGVVEDAGEDEDAREDGLAGERVPEGALSRIGEAAKRFVPEYADGQVELAFECDTSALAGCDVVVFERLYRNGALLAEHADAFDADQTIQVREPAIATVASDVLDGDDCVSADEGSRVVDTVRYENVVPGREYTLRGELMRKMRAADAEATQVESLLDADGEPVVSAATFTPESSSGQAEVVFDFDSRFGDGDDIVVYETLLRDEAVMATDCDPDNADQSFSVRAASTWTCLEDARTQTKQVTADSEAELSDAVGYADAVPGEDYTVYGMLVDPQTGLPLLAHGDAADESADARRAEELMRALLGAGGATGAEDLRAMHGSLDSFPRLFDLDALQGVIARYPDIAERLVTASRSFTAEQTSGSVVLTYALDARGLEGREATSCIALVKDGSGEAVCGESDLGSEAQTVVFVAGSLQTTATDATDGDSVLLNSREARIADEVRYEGLTPGKEYIVEGLLYDKATGEPLLVADKPVSASKYFVPAASSGTETVEFSFDASGLVGRSLVVFEHLYREMEVESGRSEKSLVALHADITAEAQTVRIEGQRTPLAGTGYDKTGDASAPMLAAAIGAGIITLAGAAYGIRQIRARNRRAQAAVQRALRGTR